jgi:transposase
MPFVSTRAKLVLSEPDAIWLRYLAQSRTAAAAKVQRAQILLRYSQGETVSAIATVLRTNRPKIERCLSKALQLGVRAALEDLPGRGRPARITDEEKAWVVNLACQKPKELGYAQELWTTRLLAKPIGNHGRAAGHEPLAKLGRGTVSKILAAHPLRPHKLE